MKQLSLNDLDRAEVAQTWLKLQQLFVSTTSPNKVGAN